jgi:hypothetical protein
VKSTTTPEFWERFYRLPKEVQQLARKNYLLWVANPHHRSLHFKRIKRNLWSARIGIHYRATGVFLDSARFRWTWIGTHEEYNKLYF